MQSAVRLHFTIRVNHVIFLLKNYLDCQRNIGQNRDRSMILCLWKSRTSVSCTWTIYPRRRPWWRTDVFFRQYMTNKCTGRKFYNSFFAVCKIWLRDFGFISKWISMKIHKLPFCSEKWWFFYFIQLLNLAIKSTGVFI